MNGFSQTTQSERLKSALPTFNGKALGSSFFKPTLQPKLHIAPSNDAYEREADSIAGRVLGTNQGESLSPHATTQPPVVQRMCADCEEEEKKVHRKETTGASTGMAAPAVVHDVVSMPG